MHSAHLWLIDNGFAIMLTLLIGFIIFYFGGIIIKLVINNIIYAKGRGHGWKKDDIKKRQDTLASLSSGVWRILVTAVVVLTLFKIFFPMIDLGPVFASAGILGVALGFGAQSVIKDFLSGLFIVTENQFRVGDVVTIDNMSGTVERIGARSTSMRDVQGGLHYVPNGLIGHTINLTNGYASVRFDVKISPDSDLEKATKIINKIGKDLALSPEWKNKIIDVPAFLRIGDFDALSVALTVSGTAYPPHQWDAVAAMKRQIFEQFLKHDIKLAYPIPPGLIETK